MKQRVKDRIAHGTDVMMGVFLGATLPITVFLVFNYYLTRH